MQSTVKNKIKDIITNLKNELEAAEEKKEKKELRAKDFFRRAVAMVGKDTCLANVTKVDVDTSFKKLAEHIPSEYITGQTFVFKNHKGRKGICMEYHGKVLVVIRKEDKVRFYAPKGSNFPKELESEKEWNRFLALLEQKVLVTK